MPLTDLRRTFELLKRGRRINIAAALAAVGEFGVDASRVLATNARIVPFGFQGQGGKSYGVAALPGTDLRFSRAINQNLYIADSVVLASEWVRLSDAVMASRGTGRLTGIAAGDVDRVIYSAVISFAAAVDLFQPGDRGGPGTYLEMVMGPLLSALTGRTEQSAVVLPVPETGDVEKIPVDLSYLGEPGEIALVVPTKISTRERISQAYVHQLILDRAKAVTGVSYRSVLVAANENNTAFPPKTLAANRTHTVGFTKETLVPGTIVLYHKYVSQLSGIYYLDPPHRYVHSPPPSFPHVDTVGMFLTVDLPQILTP